MSPRILAIPLLCRSTGEIVAGEEVAVAGEVDVVAGEIGAGEVVAGACGCGWFRLE